jgi:C4-dicarboxylate-specific signal transduction histidine kinase
MSMQDQRAAHKAILDRLNRRLRTLCQCTSTFFQAESEQELLQSICEILVAGGEVRLAWIGYCEDDAEKTVRPVAQAGSGLDYLERVKTSWGELETGQGPAGIAARTGKACWVDDIRTDPRFSSWRVAALARGYASCIAVPLIAHSKQRGAVDLRGTLNLYSAECNAFDESAAEHYTGLATSVAYAVTALRGRLAEDLAYGVTALRARAERRQAEEALHQAREELAHVTRVTTLGELAASIAHEINQPLAAIIADASACLHWLEVDRPDLDSVREALAAVVKDGDRAAEVITRIRALLSRSSVAHGPCDLAGVIRDVLLLVGPELGRHGTVLQTSLATDLPPVMGDRVQLQQVLLNLLLNAAEAVRTVPLERRRLVVRSTFEQRDDGRWAVVAVEDAGVGFRQEQAAHLFEAFYTTKPGGLGMGLSISRSIMDGHRGRLWATANADHGATFHFALPEMR